MSRFLLLALLLNLLAVSPALAHDDHPPKVLDEALYRATPMPDRIMLTWKGDPARSQAVTWRTDTIDQEGARADRRRRVPGPTSSRRPRSCRDDQRRTKATWARRTITASNFRSSSRRRSMSIASATA